MPLTGPVDPEEQIRASELVGSILYGFASESWVQHVEYDDTQSRWYFRFSCEGRDGATIYFDLHERTLRYEEYFLPAFEGDPIALYRWALQKNERLRTVHFSLGEHGDLYLRGRMSLQHLTQASIEEVIGECYQVTEAHFLQAVRLAKRAGQ